MSTGYGYRVLVKHIATDDWMVSGPIPERWGFFQSESSAKTRAQHYQALGLQAKVERFEVDYDDR